MQNNHLNSSLKILQHIFFFRNFTILFVCVMVLIATFSLNLQLPALSLGIIVLIITVANIISFYLLKHLKTISNSTIFFQLLFDIFSFSIIFYLSGGATNPFTFYYLIPIAISATVIPGKLTWLLMTIAIAAYSVLLKYYQPLSTSGHQHHQMDMDGMFSQHILGMWFGFLISAILLTWFITRLAKELKQRDEAIANAHENELRYEQMVTLGTLATGTAHELGTPLATISIIAEELTDGFEEKNQPDLFHNKKIIRDQIARCKTILSVLSDKTGESRAETGHLIPIQKYLEQTIQHWQDTRHDVSSRIQINPQLTGMILSDKTLSQALINLINNSADASEHDIQITAELSKQQECTLTITDNGIGMSDEQIALAGDVSFSTKPHGMGIGLFLALTTIRRYGGSVHFKRQQPTGTQTIISLPLEANNAD